MKPAQPPSRILVVDDTDEVLMSVVVFLEGEGFSVLKASSALEALTIMESTDGVDVVLTDLEMPNMNGLQLAVAIKDRHPTTHVVLMSGWPGGNDEVAQLVGAERFFPKPLEWERLTEFLRSIRVTA